MKFNLKAWLTKAQLVRSTEDPLSAVRVGQAIQAVEKALDSIEGLTLGERSQALASLASLQGMRSLVASGVLGNAPMEPPQ